MFRALFMIGLTLAPGAASAAAIQGTRGVATRSAVVRMSDLAARDSRVSAERPPLAVPLLRGPGERVVPPSAVRAARLSGPEALPPSGTVASYPYVTGFLALGDDGSRIPPDTQGAAGPTRLFVTLNSQVRVQDRSGAELSTVTLADFWSAVGPFPSAVGAFDPRALYDPYASRFIVTSASDPGLPAASLLIGVSQTSDPMGAWNLFRVDADPADTTFYDFPTVGFDRDWIVVQVGVFSSANEDFRESHVFAFDKADLYADGVGVFTRFVDLSGAYVSFPATTLDTTVTTMYLVDSWNGDDLGVGYLRLSTITGPVGGETFSPGIAYPSTPNPWAAFAKPNFAPQLGSSDSISVIDDRIGGVVYRGGAIWCVHTVFYPSGAPTRSSVQWWQLDPTGTVLQRGTLDDPSGTHDYGFPSIAVNRFGDALIGYARFAATEYAGAGFTYRLASDPAGTLRADTPFKAGEDWYYKDFHAKVNRWGDYSATMVDPADDVSFWTIQEYAAPQVSGVSYWGTWWAHVRLSDVAPGPAPPGLAVLGLALAGLAAFALRARLHASLGAVPSGGAD